MTEQLHIDFTPARAPAASGELHIIASHPALFDVRFTAWLDVNWHVWREFEKQADQMRRLGYKVYSARTIVHFLRHHTAVAEVGGGWKINNNVSPDLARLYMLKHDCDGYFETRVMPYGLRVK